MTTLNVDGIQLDFDDSWQVVSSDGSPWYREKIGRLQGQVDGRVEGPKAVDVVGLRDEIPYLIEVKDFKGFAIESKKRHVSELLLEVGLKARSRCRFRPPPGTGA